MDSSVAIRRLVTSHKGAGLLAQAWIWPRDLEPSEIHELWIETKGRYPLWKPGLSSYRPPPIMKGASKSSLISPLDAKRPKSALKKGSADAGGGGAPGGGGATSNAPELPWDKFDPIIEKDNAAMVNVPLASKLAFQRMQNVFAVLVDYAEFSNSFIVIDRVHNLSPTAEISIEVALRKNQGTGPVVLVMDSRPRLEAANKMLRDLVAAGFLHDEEKAYADAKNACKAANLQEPRLTEYKLTSTDHIGPKADLRRLVTSAGLAWLRAAASELRKTEAMINDHPRHRNMCQLVTDIYRLYKPGDLSPDGRPKMQRIWRVFYEAQLFASGTHYVIFDSIEPLAKPVIQTLGTVGTIFINGSTEEHKKLLETIQDGSPVLLLESTGGVTQAFAYVVKAVRMMKPRWDIDFVLRLVTEYKQRSANNEKKERVKATNRKFLLENIHLLDKQLARIDVALASSGVPEAWMQNFGLPEMLMLFEVWQRSPEFLMRQVQLADVMKKSAESLLDLFTGCFSGGVSIPELGLGNAATKVVATAWNRHLMLFNNATVYGQRATTMQFVLWFVGLMSTALSVFISNFESLQGNAGLNFIMLISPITAALLGTIGTRLRQQQKFSICKMASFEIVSEIYKFRVRAIEYDQLALALVLRPPTDDKKKDDEPVAPIPSKEKDKLARRVFVSRVQMIYTNCMQSESKRARAGGASQRSNTSSTP